MSNNNTGAGGNLGTAMVDIATTGAGVSANFPPLATPARITEMMQRENDDLRIRNQDLRAREQIAKEANDAMRALCAELRDALEPFRAEWATWILPKGGHRKVVIAESGFDPAEAEFTTADLERAAIVCAKTPATMGEELKRLREVEARAQLDQQTAADNTARDHAEITALRQQLAERDAEVNSAGDVLLAAGYPDPKKELWQDIRDLAADRDALRARVSELTESLEHSKQWYACRVERLTEWVRKQDQAKLLPEQIVHDFFAIKRLVAAGKALLFERTGNRVGPDGDDARMRRAIAALDAALADNGGATAANVSTPAPQTKIIGPAKGTPTAVRFLDDASPTETGAWGFKVTDDTVFPAPLAQVQDGKVEIYGTAEAITAAFKDCPEQQWVLTLLLEILRLREKLGGNVSTSSTRPADLSKNGAGVDTGAGQSNAVRPPSQRVTEEMVRFARTDDPWHMAQNLNAMMELGYCPECGLVPVGCVREGCGRAAMQAAKEGGR
jgi:hypothetical protein